MAWSRSPVLFTKTIEKAVVKRAKDFARDVSVAIVEISPVDTSRYVSNHNISVNGFDLSNDPSLFSGRAGAMSRILADVDAISDDKIQDIYITNTTIYTLALEGGHSAQAPYGVYRVSFLAIAAWYK